MSNKIRSLAKARERQQAKAGMLTMTLSTLVTSEQSLGTLIGQALPIRASFQISKIVRLAGAELQGYQESRKTLCEKYANKDADGRPIMLGPDDKPVKEGEPGRYDIPADNLEAFNKEHAELLTVEVAIPGQQIKVSELGDVRIAPAHIMALDWLLTE